MIAALNRTDGHHRWATRVLAEARRFGWQIGVPEAVAGEAFTKLRYDRRISGRRDARPALVVFGLLDDNPGLFKVTESPSSSYSRSRALLAQYPDQDFSYVDALVLLTADDDRGVERVFTVDASLAAYRFSRSVVVASPDADPR